MVTWWSPKVQKGNQWYSIVPDSNQRLGGPKFRWLGTLASTPHWKLQHSICWYLMVPQSIMVINDWSSHLTTSLESILSIEIYILYVCFDLASNQGHSVEVSWECPSSLIWCCQWKGKSCVIRGYSWWHSYFHWVMQALSGNCGNWHPGCQA